MSSPQPTGTPGYSRSPRLLPVVQSPLTSSLQTRLRQLDGRLPQPLCPGHLLHQYAPSKTAEAGAKQAALRHTAISGGGGVGLIIHTLTFLFIAPIPTHNISGQKNQR